MITKDYKVLLAKLNDYITQSLHGALGLCVSRGHGEVSIEHLLITLLEDGRGDIPLILSHFDIAKGDVSKGINKALEEFRTGGAGRPSFSPKLLELYNSFIQLFRYLTLLTYFC